MKQEFISPSNEFTPMPFWFWNDRLEKDEILRQIRDFHGKGIAGFIIHPRIGLPHDLEYLSDQYMEFVGYAVHEAARLNMRVILYDEGMYPSGSAHGLVALANPRFASRGLRMRCVSFSQNLYLIVIMPELKSGELLTAVLAAVQDEARGLHADTIHKIEVTNGSYSFKAPTSEDWVVMEFIETFTEGRIRGIHFGEDDGEPNAPLSADLLNPRAVESFIALTHDRYYSAFKEFFGTTIIGMFTDEPSILGRCSKRNLIPWTDDFLDWYLSLGNRIEDLPGLWLDIGETTESIRRRYRDAVKMRLEYSFYKPISEWCARHGIALTGHPESSEDIGLLKHFHIPGQDVVWRWVGPEGDKGVTGPHSTMAKGVSDAARHSQKRRNANECFGCCGPDGIQWAFSPSDMKWYLDWLFLRGTNLIMPHAFFYSVRGGKRYGERPPDVGPNNIWWKYYDHVSRYIKRMSWLMTDSVNLASLAVICEAEHLPWQICKPLYQNQIDFNYLEHEYLGHESCLIRDGYLSIGHQIYTAAAIEAGTSLSRQAADALQAFIDSGGSVIGYGNEVDFPKIKGLKTVQTSKDLVFTLDTVLKRTLRLNFACSDLRVSCVKKGGNIFYLLVNEGQEVIQGEAVLPIMGRLERWDPWTGSADELPVLSCTPREMTISIVLSVRESMILSIYPEEEPQKESTDTYPMTRSEIIQLHGPWAWGDPACGPLVRIDTLKPWQQGSVPGEPWGTKVYECSFICNDAARLRRAVLDLGQVCEIAHVYLNGKDCGFSLWPPYRFEIQNAMRNDSNTLRIEITGSLAPKYDLCQVVSGLIGPAVIHMEYNTI